MLRSCMLAAVALSIACTCGDPPPAPASAPPAEIAPPAPGAPQIYEVTIASAPSGATVLLEGAELGKTPYLIKFKTQTSVMLEADGYVAREVTVGPDSEPTVVAQMTPLEGGPPATDVGGGDGGALAPTVARAPASSGSASAHKSKSASTGSSTPAPSAPSTPAPAPKSSLPYDNVTDAKSDYQAGKIDRDAYDQAVRKLKARRNEKIAVIKALYQKGAIDKGEYQQRKRVIDNEYKGV
ncbi:MAG TPA: PEGA domain-containing protein [Nannocystaceae bacterium]|nr:PEGA domain-containing protein [Nannocystaceae bacterium]